jgi:ParB family chromosome partitioning protein
VRITFKANLTDIALDLIDVPTGRARSFDPVWSEALAAIIGSQGLLNPVTLRADGARFRLVAGLHRLEAVRSLGWNAIPARLSQAETDDAARLEEVMENLGRHELVALDRCQHLWELKQVWERMYPQAKHGGSRPGAGRPPASGEIKSRKLPLDLGAGRPPVSGEIKWQKLPLASDGPEIFGFSKATAEKIGLSERAIRLSVTIWTRLHPPLRRRLRGTALANKQTELKALSELSARRQVAVVDLILGGAHRDIGNVAQALEYLEGGIVPNVHERRFLAAKRTLDKLDDDTFRSVIVAHRDRVLSALGLGTPSRCS